MAAALFATSIAVVYLQVALVRFLDYVYYGTFTSLVVGLALIGFGAGGTFLALNRKRIRGREAGWMTVFAAITGFGMAVGYLALVMIRLDLAYLFFGGRELVRFLLLILALIPGFFGGGALIGSVLIAPGGRRHLLYALNLAASGLGGLAGLGAARLLSPVVAPLFALLPAAIALIATAVVWRRGRGRRPALYVVAAAWVALTVFWRPEIPTDPYKDIAALRNLETQGEATFLAAANTPYGRLEAARSPAFHHHLFSGFGGGATLPRQIALYRDGNLIGAPYLVEGSADSAIEGDFPPEGVITLAYRVVKPDRVLIVGDAGLTGAWTALREGAGEIVLLLPDPPLERYLREELVEATRALFARSEVTVVTDDYRRYLVAHPGRFDLVHLAAVESLAAPSAGLYAAREDFLLTVESMEAAWRALAPGGALVAARGIQTPPRDNLKILLTLDAAIPSAMDHLYQARDFLAVVTLAVRTGASRDPDISRRFREACGHLSLDIEYEPGIGNAAPPPYRYKIPGPPESPDSWYRYAARRVASGAKTDLIRDWPFDIRPAVDDRPFFHSFFRWRNLEDFLRLYGRYWFRRSDLGTLVLLVTFVGVTLAAFGLVLLPHLTRGAPLRTGFLAYFPVIGWAFMFLEMVMIKKATLYLGQPAVSVPVVLAVVLTASGAGSAFQGRLNRDPYRTVSLAVVPLLVALALFLGGTQFVGRSIAVLGEHGPVFPYLLTALLTGLPAFFMGWFFAPGLDRLEAIDPASLPTAWALNGFASVAASPAAVMMAVGWGFRAVAGLAAGAYIVAWWLARVYRIR